jgi:hypothetical protein
MRRLAYAIVLGAVLASVRATVGADEKPIPWDRAEEHVGQTAVVEGRVLGVHCSPTSCLLAFDPTFNRFTAVVQAKDFKTLPPETLNANYVGRLVRVRGKIQVLEKKPEIIVEKPADIELVVTAKDRAAKREAAADDVLDRLDEILDRLDDLSARLDETQARLEQVATALDEQGATIAQIAAIQAESIGQSFDVGPQPSYGEPQPRPGYEAMRTIKRGMTSEEVARLVGEPISSDTLPNGAVVWDYGYGRSITFDTRNRATALSGFPAP